MKGVRHLLVVEAWAILALVVGSLIGGFILAFLEPRGPLLAMERLASVAIYGPFAAFGAVMIGAPLVVLYGAPAYAILMPRSRYPWVSVLVIGLLPGVVAHFAGWREIGLLVCVFGGTVAVLTHAFARRDGVHCRAAT